MKPALIHYPPRIKALRSEIIKTIPKVPNKKKTVVHLEGVSTSRLILAYLTWRMRLIPSRPRTVKIWGAGVDYVRYLQIKDQLQTFLADVEAGKDLIPYLSDRVRSKGFILPVSGSEFGKDDQDMILTRMGLHHFHVGKRTPQNPKGRSNHLIFAEVKESEFTIIAIADHKVFERDSPERLDFHKISTAYIEKNIPPGQAYMLNPVMSSGHSMTMTMFSDRCEDQMAHVDPKLDDPDFVDKLYNDQPIERDGQTVQRPAKPSFKWHFEDMRFGILDKKTHVFFCIFPFFSR